MLKLQVKIEGRGENRRQKICAIEKISVILPRKSPERQAVKAAKPRAAEPASGVKALAQSPKRIRPGCIAIGIKNKNDITRLNKNDYRTS